MKFQSVTLPHGLIANMFRPIGINETTRSVVKDVVSNIFLLGRYNPYPTPANW